MRPVVVGATKKRSGGRRRISRRHGMVGDLKGYGFNFLAAAAYGYARGGHTQNFNELMDKLPGGDQLGKDLRNGLAFYLVNRFAFGGRSRILDQLTIAAVCRSGDKFGVNKFAKLEGADDLEGSMD